MVGGRGNLRGDDVRLPDCPLGSAATLGGAADFDIDRDVVDEGAVAAEDGAEVKINPAGILSATNTSDEAVHGKSPGKDGPRPKPPHDAK